MYFCDFDKSCFYNNVHNLYELILPYANTYPEDHLPCTTYMNIHKLTIDRFVFTFSDPALFPSTIILPKELCRRPIHYINGLAVLQIATDINNYIMQKVEEYRSQKRKRSLNK